MSIRINPYLYYKGEHVKIPFEKEGFPPRLDDCLPMTVSYGTTKENILPRILESSKYFSDLLFDEIMVEWNGELLHYKKDNN